MSYILVCSKEVSQGWIAKKKAELDADQAPVSIRKIYRWGSMWGELTGDGRLRVESRVLVEDGPDYSIYSTSPQPQHVPKDVDDCWEEEFIVFSTNCVYNGLLWIRTGDVPEECRKLGIAPTAQTEHLHTTAPTKPAPTTTTYHTTYKKPTHGCMIQD